MRVQNLRFPLNVLDDCASVREMACKTAVELGPLEKQRHTDGHRPLSGLHYILLGYEIGNQEICGAAENVNLRLLELEGAVEMGDVPDIPQGNLIGVLTSGRAVDASQKPSKGLEKRLGVAVVWDCYAEVQDIRPFSFLRLLFQDPKDMEILLLDFVDFCNAVDNDLEDGVALGTHLESVRSVGCRGDWSDWDAFHSARWVVVPDGCIETR